MLRRFLQWWAPPATRKQAAPETTPAPDPLPPLTDPLALRLDGLMRRLHALPRMMVPGSNSGSESGNFRWACVEIGPYRLYWATEIHDDFWPCRLRLDVPGATRNQEMAVWTDGGFQAPGPWQIHLPLLVDELERLVNAGEAAAAAYESERKRQEREREAALWESARARAATWSPAPSQIVSKEG